MWGLSEHIDSVEFYAIGTDPVGLAALHGIEAVAIDPPEFGVTTRKADGASFLPIRVFRRLLHEWRQLRRARDVLRGTDAFIVAGTGLLEDDTDSFGWFFALLRWTVAARLRGCFVAFVSVGAGHVGPRLARLLVRAALRLAHYVSYRDQSSKEWMRKIGVRVDNHCIFPDLAFCLPVAGLTNRSLPDGEAVRIGFGVIAMEGRVAPSSVPDARARYLTQLAEFAASLKRSEMAILYGDAAYDLPLAEDALDLSQRRLGECESTKVTLHHTATFQELMEALASLDVVIGARYHNLVLALLLGKPAIALAYHTKHYDLVEQFGLRQFAQDFLSFEAAELAKSLDEILGDWHSLAERIKRENACSRDKLQKQFVRLATLLSAHRPQLMAAEHAIAER